MIVKKCVDLVDLRGSPKPRLLLCVEARRVRVEFYAYAYLRGARDRLLSNGSGRDSIFVAYAVNENLH